MLKFPLVFRMLFSAQQLKTLKSKIRIYEVNIDRERRNRSKSAEGFMEEEKPTHSQLLIRETDRGKRAGEETEHRGKQREEERQSVNHAHMRVGDRRERGEGS